MASEIGSSRRYPRGSEGISKGERVLKQQGICQVGYQSHSYVLKTIHASVENVMCKDMYGPEMWIFSFVNGI